MKPTLYEALGLSRTAAEAEIKAALRRLVRRYYAKTRAGHQDVEEALRFLNHASHILGNSARRAEYDAELAESVRADSALTTIGGPIRNEEPAAAAISEIGDSISQLGLPRDRAPAAAELAPQWSAQLADIRRTPAGQLIALFSMAFVLLVAWLVAVPRTNALPMLGFWVALLVMLAATAGVVFGVVHLLSRSVWEPPAPESALTLVEGMIPRWRKDRTVFLGTGAPVEDATWLFRLRMAELKRVKAERVSDPRPAMRLLARLFDYSVWGMIVVAVIAGLVRLQVFPAQGAELLLHPLIAPVFVSASWIPIEAFLLTRTQTTPGRWLLCVYLQHEVSNPYAPEELRFTFRAAAARAADVWWRGCSAWLPIVSLVTVARAREHLKRAGETRWDSERDCLVTHGPVGRISLLTLALGLAACTLVFAAHWRAPLQEIRGAFGQSFTSLVASVGSARAPSTAPPASGPQSRITRLDDTVATTDDSTTRLPPSTMPEVAAVRAPDAAPATGSTPAATAESAPTAPIPPSAPMPGARSTPDDSAPAAIARVPEAAAGTGPESTAGASASAAPAPSPGTSAKSFLANLWRKPQPVEPAPPTQEEIATPSPLELRERRVAEYMRQAQRQQSAGDYSGLAKTCTRWADDDWRNPRAYYCLGLGLQGTGQHKQAIAMFNKAGSLLPKNDPLKTLIGDAVVRSFRAQGGG